MVRIIRFATVKYLRKLPGSLVASVMFLVYDCLLTFSDEVEFVWCSPWNLGKALFVGTRYLVFIDSSLMLIYLLDSELSDEYPSYDVMALPLKVDTDLMGIGAVIAGVIMSIRVYTLWEKSRRVLAVLVLSVLMAFIFVILMYTKVQSEMDWRYSTYRGALIAIVYRDELLYFICLFAFSTANFVNSQWQFGDGDYYDLLIEMQHCFHSVVSARIILNMREASKVGQNEVTLDAVSFATPISEANTFELTVGSHVRMDFI
ncbi:hypothetical protein M0805_001501 [Coniferiporia weirii]|nr:hypothetical protein M0805_001501 [Coniferiporia weirii]